MIVEETYQLAVFVAESQMDRHVFEDGGVCVVGVDLELVVAGVEVAEDVVVVTEGQQHQLEAEANAQDGVVDAFGPHFLDVSEHLGKP